MADGSSSHLFDKIQVEKQRMKGIGDSQRMLKSKVSKTMQQETNRSIFWSCPKKQASGVTTRFGRSPFEKEVCDTACAYTSSWLCKSLGIVLVTATASRHTIRLVFSNGYLLIVASIAESSRSWSTLRGQIRGRKQYSSCISLSKPRIFSIFVLCSESGRHAACRRRRKCRL